MDKKFLKSRLSIKSFLIVLFFSIFISIVFSVFQLYQDYGDELKNINQSFDDVEKTTVDPIAMNIWDYSEEAVNMMLNNLRKIPYIHNVDIEYRQSSMIPDKTVMKTENKVSQYEIRRTIPIIYTEKINNQKYFLGNLVISSDLNKVRESNINNYIKKIYMEIIKNFIISFSVFIIFSFVITLPLTNITEYLKRIDIDNLNSNLYIRNKKRKDELADLSNSINEMLNNLRNSLEEEKNVREQYKESLEQEKRAKERFKDLINIVSHFSEIIKKDDEKVFSELFRTASKIIGNDYGSVYIFEDNNWRYIDALGHNADSLKALVLKKEWAIDYDKKNIEIIDNIIIKAASSTVMPEDISAKIVAATKPFKSTLLCPLFVNEVKVGTMSFDLSISNTKNFTREDIEIARTFKEITEAFLNIRYYTNQVHDFTEKLEEYNETLEEKVALRTSELEKTHNRLENALKYEKMNKERFRELINIVSNFSDMFKMSDAEVFSVLLKTAIKIIGNDYGSAIMYHGEEWYYLDAIGHDKNLLNSIRLKKEWSITAKLEHIIKIDEIVESRAERMPADVIEIFKKASKPIKSTIFCPLFVNKEQIGALCFDMAEENTKFFTDEDMDIAKTFQEIAETLLSIKYYNNKLEEISEELEIYNLNLENKVKERTAELEEAQNKLQIESQLKIDAEEKQRQIAEELKDSLKAMTSSLKLSDVFSVVLERLIKIVNYNAGIVLIKNRNKNEYEILASKGDTGLIDKYEIIQEKNKEFITFIIDKNNKIMISLFTKEEFMVFNLEEVSKTLLFLPIRLKNKFVGVIVLEKNLDKEITEAEKSMLVAFMELVILSAENARLFEEINYFAKIDGLTGVNNRRYFFELAQKEFIRSKRYGDKLSVIMIDIDKFKNFNDTYGHLTGDEVLKHIAEITKNNVRELDIVGRYGGEEFMIILPETSADHALDVAERLRKSIESSKIDTEFGKLSITVSVGIAEFNNRMDTIENLLSLADTALYISKNNGRNMVSIAK